MSVGYVSRSETPDGFFHPLWSTTDPSNLEDSARGVMPCEVKKNNANANTNAGNAKFSANIFEICSR